MAAAAAATLPAMLIQAGAQTATLGGGDVRDPTRRYKKYELIGQGAQKKVYRAFDEERGIEVAWNEVAVAELARFREKDQQRVFAEILVLKQLKHKNIMTLHDYWFDEARMLLVFITEIFPDGTLRQYRRRHRHADLSAIKRWAWQILQGLVYLHGHNPPIIHRDLKCDNIFVSGTSGVVKIGDLGLVTLCKDLSAPQSVLGTPEFMAPELYEEKYDEKVDVYAFGMCLLELATMEYPYSECQNAAQIYKKVTKGIQPASVEKLTSTELREFVQLCLCHDPSNRPEARQLLKHTFFEATRAAACSTCPGSALSHKLPMTPTISLTHCNSADSALLAAAAAVAAATTGNCGAGGRDRPNGGLARAMSGITPLVVYGSQAERGSGRGGMASAGGSSATSRSVSPLPSPGPCATSPHSAVLSPASSITPAAAAPPPAPHGGVLSSSCAASAPIGSIAAAAGGPMAPPGSYGVLAYRTSSLGIVPSSSPPGLQPHAAMVSIAAALARANEPHQPYSSILAQAAPGSMWYGGGMYDVPGEQHYPGYGITAGEHVPGPQPYGYPPGSPLSSTPPGVGGIAAALSHRANGTSSVHGCGAGGAAGSVSPSPVGASGGLSAALAAAYGAAGGASVGASPFEHDAYTPAPSQHRLSGGDASMSGMSCSPASAFTNGLYGAPASYAGSTRSSGGGCLLEQELMASARLCGGEAAGAGAGNMWGGGGGYVHAEGAHESPFVHSRQPSVPSSVSSSAAAIAAAAVTAAAAAVASGATGGSPVKGLPAIREDHELDEGMLFEDENGVRGGAPRGYDDDEGDDDCDADSYDGDSGDAQQQLGALGAGLGQGLGAGLLSGCSKPVSLQVRSSGHAAANMALSFAMSFTNQSGVRKKVGFQYDLLHDTASAIAVEMVENLSLNTAEAEAIAAMIEHEVTRYNQQQQKDQQ